MVRYHAPLRRPTRPPARAKDQRAPQATGHAVATRRAVARAERIAQSAREANPEQVGGGSSQMKVFLCVWVLSSREYDGLCGEYQAHSAEDWVLVLVCVGVQLRLSIWLGGFRCA